MIWLRIYIILGVVALAGAFFWNYNHIIQKNKNLTSELENANKTISALDDVLKAHNIIYETERGLIDEIDSAPQEHDAVTAPVLLNAINRLQ